MGQYPEHLREVIAADTGEDIYGDCGDTKCWECKHMKQYSEASAEDIAACDTCKSFSNFKMNTEICSVNPFCNGCKYDNHAATATNDNWQRCADCVDGNMREDK